MKKLVKNLKGFWLMLIITFIMIGSQAMCDISLPQFMSNIVNNGLSRNGIAEFAPKFMSPNDYDVMSTFMTTDEKSLLANSYESVDSPEINRNRQTVVGYDVGFSVYQKKTSLTKENSDKLDKAFLESSGALLAFAKSATPAVNPSANSPQGANVNLDATMLYKIEPVLRALPEQNILALREAASKMDTQILSAVNQKINLAFYEELGFNKQTLQNDYIKNIGITMLEIALLSGILAITVSLFSSRIACGVAKKLREQVFNKVSQFGNAEFDKISVSSLITRATNDITQIQMVLTIGIRMICYAPFMAIGGFTMAMQKAPSMAWIIGLAVAALLVMIVIIMIVALPKFKIIQKLVDRLNLIAKEHLTGQMIIRTYGNTEYENEKFHKANKDLMKTNKFVQRLMSIAMPYMTLIMSMLSLACIWFGAKYIESSTIQIGDMMAFMQYAMQVIMSFLFITMLFVFLPRAAISAGRIDEVLELPISVVEPEEPYEFDDTKRGVVEFKDVSFSYPNSESPAVSNISFTAKKGETTAIIGSTGSGKTTILNLLMRNYDATSGDVLVSGVNVRDVLQEDLMNEIGYVPQKQVLLTGDIESNIKIGVPDATDEEFAESLDIAQAVEFIEKLKDGVHTEISQGGTNVSGGQRQRLSIARALIKHSPIYAFDDSFSALDFKTDKELRDALKKNVPDACKIIVAQRVSTVMYADQIIVLNEGKIVGLGKHKDLLKTCPEYKEIVDSQMKGGVL